MNLSSLVHVRKRAHPLTVDYISEDQFLPQKYQAQRHSQGYLIENGYSIQKEQIMAASLISNPYAQQTASYAYIQVPQPPPSPPVEEIPKCSLPSISSLLGIANNNGSQQQEQPKQSSQQVPEDRKASLQYTPTSVATTPRQSLPLTPPTYSDSGSESRHSPSSSVSSTQYGGVSNPSTYYFTAGANINMDMNLQRQSIPHRESRIVSIPLSQAQYALPTSYTMTPTPHILNSYYPANPQIPNGMYFQRPLSNFTPAATNPWQHHHYIAPSSSSFPLPQDRYICPTCSKAFSRPSSLRIHSHSHTGEKPFRCPVRGCRKKFSVRSNMKRHERGCHGENGC